MHAGTDTRCRCTQVNDAYTVLLREKKLPLALLEDPEAKRAGRAARASLVATQPFAATFGAKQTRKRPRLAAESYGDLQGRAEGTGVRCVLLLSCRLLQACWRCKLNPPCAHAGTRPSRRATTTRQRRRRPHASGLFDKGQSKRIWGELYKVVDSSDVVVQVR